MKKSKSKAVRKSNRKVAKAKRKVAIKTEKEKNNMKMLILITLVTASMIIFCGCQTATPSKAQSAEINADTITVTSGGAGFVQLLSAYTNLPPDNFVMVVGALAGLAGASECNVISQAMANETGGDESNSQSASGPETPVNASVPTGTDAITALVGAGAEGIAAGLKKSGSGSESADCPDGNCVPAAPAQPSN